MSFPRRFCLAFRAAIDRRFALDPRSLAAFRIGLGGIVLADAVLRTRDLELMFAPDGMFPLRMVAEYFADPWAWSLATAVDASWWGAAMLGLEAVAGGLLMAGVGTPWTTFMAWAAVVSVLRRTAPATNAGDAWLACLLFWSIFLPGAAGWAWPRRSPEASRGTASSASGCVVATPATAALVLQIAAVYLSAGAAKWNASWLSGGAVRYVMSVHDHGTPLGQWLLADHPVSVPISWSVLALELLGPVLLIACPRPSVRMTLATTFMIFHAATCVLTSVGLFGYVGIAAWLPVIPAQTWDRLTGCPRREPASTGVAFRPPAPASMPAHVLCLIAGVAALASLVHDVTPWRATPLPQAVDHLVELFCMHQEWAMFGTVERQEQWVVARAELADGSIVDLLRDGRPFEAERPVGGFTSLPHHRWHKLFWGLPEPRRRIFAEPIAAALARHWNDRHPVGRQVTSLEIRFARHAREADGATLHELLLATWPPRDAAGHGSLERLLRTATTSVPPANPGDTATSGDGTPGPVTGVPSRKTE